MMRGLFDIQFRLDDLTKNGDPLVRLNERVNGEVFRPELEQVRKKERKSTAGRKPFDVGLMFKILVLQSLYNLSDDAVEYQVHDRLSFMRKSPGCGILRTISIALGQLCPQRHDGPGIGGCLKEGFYAAKLLMKSKG